MKEKVQKILSHSGYGSRRKIEKMIKENLIKINGKIIKIGERINVKDIHEVYICKKLRMLNKTNDTRILLYNKPIGEICSKYDIKNRPTVFDNLPKLKNNRWISIGRLDINTKGLLLFTTNGEYANSLMHPKFNISREYLVRAFGLLDVNKIKYLNNKTKLIFNQHKICQKIFFYNMNQLNKWFKVFLNSGKKNEIRKLFNSINLQVNQLIRIRYGEYYLPKNLYPGQFLEIKNSK